LRPGKVKPIIGGLEEILQTKPILCSSTVEVVLIKKKDGLSKK